jgi:carboxymethylenebutenolidase
MGSSVKLTAADGQQLGAYVAESPHPALAAVVVLQEIFGVNRHIRSVADDYASQGFWAVAPALFDRIEPNLELDYNPTDASRGMEIANEIGMENALKDVAAAVCYYGGRIAQYTAEVPRCHVMLHFGKEDKHIPPSEIGKIQRAHPELPVFLYDAGHGFNCDQRKDYAPQAASLARQRTLEFFRKHLVDG